MEQIKIEKRIFFPEIETLRAIAVIMVLFSHFIPKDNSFYIPYMWYGVQLFFTISGFLITCILLGSIYKSDQPNKSRIIKNFFIRRVLRLFPIYYLFIFTFFILRNVFSIYIWNNDYNWYFFTYLQNMYFYNVGALNTSFSHLWSLGVEEQFYLTWPFLLILLPKKVYPYLFVFLIVLSITLLTVYNQNKVYDVLTFSNFHTLGMGALLAYFYYFKRESKLFYILFKYRYCFTFFSFIVLLYTWVVGFENNYLQTATEQTFLALTIGFIVFTSVIGWKGKLAFLFNNKILHQVGKISYGIYLYHLIIPVVLKVVIEKLPFLGFLQSANAWLNFMLQCFYSFTIAYFSYYIIEVRFLKLKEKFNR